VRGDAPSRNTALHRVVDVTSHAGLDAERCRLALLAGGSVAAGLACGLAVPGAAEATPATHGTTPTGTAPTPSGTLLAAASIFDGARSDGATADPSAVVVAAAAPTRVATSATATPVASQPVPAKSTAASLSRSEARCTRRHPDDAGDPRCARLGGAGSRRTPVTIAALLGRPRTLAGSSRRGR
jgi:hypothetical protein